MKGLITPLCIVSALIVGHGSARAADAQSEAVQAVIASQIEAFGRDDAVAAHSFASPGIQQKFPDAPQFLAMVKQSYPALIRPRSTRFEPLTTTELGTVQKVTVIDSAGVVWTAVYTLEQVDGAWRITGCALLKLPDTSA